MMFGIGAYYKFPKTLNGRRVLVLETLVWWVPRKCLVLILAHLLHIMFSSSTNPNAYFGCIREYIFTYRKHEHKRRRIFENIIFWIYFPDEITFKNTIASVLASQHLSFWLDTVGILCAHWLLITRLCNILVSGWNTRGKFW